MPCAPRPSKKAQRILEDILGVPENMKKQRKSSYSRERVVQQDTRLVR